MHYLNVKWYTQLNFKRWNHIANNQMYFINLILHCKDKHLGLYKCKQQNLHWMFVVLEGKKPRHGRSLNVLQQIKGKEEVVHTFNKIVLSHEKNDIMPFVAT